MALTVLQLVQEALGEINTTAPAALAGSTDPAAVQCKAIIHACGRDLRAKKCWSQLKKNHSFTTSNGVSTYALPSDFYCSILKTYWDKTNKRPLSGPLTDSQMDLLLYGLTPSGPRTSFRIFGQTNGNMFELTPTPSTTNLNLTFDYLSTNWILSSGAWKETITADTDTTAFDDDLMIYGIQYKWLRSIGLAYQPYEAEWETRINKAQARWQGNRIHNLSPAERPWGLNIPEGNYNV